VSKVKDMNLKDFIVHSIDRATRQVFSTMLGVQLRAGEAAVEDASADAKCEVRSFVGLAGAWAGAGSLSCSDRTARKIYSHMLALEAHSVNEEVLDAVAELTNMVLGNVKTELEHQLGPIGLSIPTVIYDRNFKTKTASTEWIVVRFLWDGDYLSVKVCLAPQDQSSVYPVPCEGVCVLSV